MEILIQIVAPGLDIAHNPVQSPLRSLFPRSIADPYNDLMHIQLSVGLEHILITHIGKYAVEMCIRDSTHPFHNTEIRVPAKKQAPNGITHLYPSRSGQ